LKKTLGVGKISHNHGSAELLPKAMDIFCAIPIKILMTFLTEAENSMLNFI
jgi:hypothetical protein